MLEAAALMKGAWWQRFQDFLLVGINDVARHATYVDF
jgi:hypothetical protein